MGDANKIRETREREKQAILRMLDHDGLVMPLFHSTVRKLSLPELTHLREAIAREISRARVEGERVMQAHMKQERHAYDDSPYDLVLPAVRRGLFPR